MNPQDFNHSNEELDIELKLSQRKGPPDDRWKKGPKITKEQLKTAPLGDGDFEFWKGRKFKEISLGSEGDAKVSSLIKFGKYKGKTYQWVYDNDKNYHWWACENVPNYKHNVESNLKK